MLYTVKNVSDEASMTAVKKICTYILLILLTLFFIELLIGGNGAWLTIAGFYIRKIIFIIVLAYSIIYILVFERNLRFTKLDIAVASFIVVSSIWIFIIPVLNGNSITTAFSEANDIYLLLMYFPVSILIRKKVINWERIRSLFLWGAGILALWHIVIFVLDNLMPGSYAAYFQLISTLSMNTAVNDNLVSQGYVRIIHPSSLYLVAALAVVLFKTDKKWYHYILAALFALGLVTTYTRAFWIGALIIMFCALIPVLKGRRSKSEYSRRAICVAGLAVLVVAVNLWIIPPLTKNYPVDALTETQKQQVIKQTDLLNRLETTVNSEDVGNISRVDQIKRFIKEIVKNPVYGKGYGASVQGYQVGAESFMYDVTGLALLFKLGWLGIIPWMGLLAFAIIMAAKAMKKTKNHTWFLGCLALMLGYLTSIQTNNFLFSPIGMSIILYVLLDITNMTEVPPEAINEDHLAEKHSSPLTGNIS
jgi:hypothetical protein